MAGSGQNNTASAFEAMAGVSRPVGELRRQEQDHGPAPVAKPPQIFQMKDDLLDQQFDWDVRLEAGSACLPFSNARDERLRAIAGNLLDVKSHGSSASFRGIQFQSNCLVVWIGL